MQGYYFARPAESLVAEDACRDVFDHLREVSARRRPDDAAGAHSGHAGNSRRPHKPLRPSRAAGNVVRLRKRFSIVPTGGAAA
jgi:hypothetical protein